MSRDFEELDWDQTSQRLYLVVRGRSAIQFAAHDLLVHIKSRQESGIPDEVLRQRYESLVAVTFSLWRAIFLADGVADWDAILANAETFLEKLIRDNSINYLDDWNNRSWSLVYYLANARYRLKELADTWPEFNASLGNTSKWLDKPFVGSHSVTMWEQHCTALQAAVFCLERQK